MWHQTPAFNSAIVGTWRWMGQGSAEAFPASGFRHLLRDKKQPWPWRNFGQQEGIQSRGNQDNWAGPCGQGCGEARLGHQLGRGHVQGCSRAGDVSSGLSGAGADSSRGWNVILHHGRGSARGREGL